MKKILLLMLAAIPCLGFSQVKNAGCYLRMVRPVNDNLAIVNDSLEVTFGFNSMNYFCEVSVKNKTNEVIQIDWDKFIMVMEGESLSILFDDTRMINKDAKKGQSSIAPASTLSKNVAPADYIELDMPLYNKGWVKKRGDQEIGFVIPVLFGGELKYYNCSISVSLK